MTDCSPQCSRCTVCYTYLQGKKIRLPIQFHYEPIVTSNMYDEYKPAAPTVYDNYANIMIGKRQRIIFAKK